MIINLEFYFEDISCCEENVKIDNESRYTMDIQWQRNSKYRHSCEVYLKINITSRHQGFLPGVIFI